MFNDFVLIYTLYTHSVTDTSIVIIIYYVFNCHSYQLWKEDATSTNKNVFVQVFFFFVTFFACIFDTNNASFVILNVTYQKKFRILAKKEIIYTEWEFYIFRVFEKVSN